MTVDQFVNLSNLVCAVLLMMFIVAVANGLLVASIITGVLSAVFVVENVLIHGLVKTKRLYPGEAAVHILQ